MRSGDLTVILTRTGTHHLRDIDVVVAYGDEVTIPAEKALISRDLHIALAQRLLFLVKTTNAQGGVVATSVPNQTSLQKTQPPNVPVIEHTDSAGNFERIWNILAYQQQVLMGLIQTVQIAPKQTNMLLEEHTKLLGSILTTLKERPVGGGIPVTQVMGGMEEGEERTLYIPSKIAPTVSEVFVNVQETTKDGTGTQEASKALKALRNK